MPSLPRFPASARAAWILRNAQKPHAHHLTDADRERRLLAKEVCRELREASLEQLAEVAKLLGHTPRWIEMVRLEARRPGVVGKACLRAAK